MANRTLDEFIALFFHRPPTRFGIPEETTSDRVGVIYRGSAGFEGGERLVWRNLPAGFSEVEAFGDCFRTVWVSELHRAILTYCEGDLDLTVDRCSELFNARVASAARFYMGVGGKVGLA